MKYGIVITGCMRPDALNAVIVGEVHSYCVAIPFFVNVWP